VSAARPPDPGPLFDSAAAGDRRSLARLLSWVEQGDAAGRAVAGRAYRSGADAATVGITGAPGAGKSTLTAGVIAAARTAGVAQLGVLAVDPSSPFSGGAILGDRIRMQEHALDEGVYVRSLATRGSLGGLALAVPESVRVLAAVGMTLVLVETVGVGQVEVDVAAATDTTVVVVNPRWGDAVQASKAGLLEVADVFVINKADQPGARETRRDLEQMLDLAPHSAWRPPVMDTVATTGEGIDDLWEAVVRHQRHLAESGQLAERRRARLEHELRRVVAVQVDAEVERLLGPGGLRDLADAVARGRVDPYEAVAGVMARRGGTRGSGRTGGAADA
jgi:LAO/AO transport system kinase